MFFNNNNNNKHNLSTKLITILALSLIWAIIGTACASDTKETDTKETNPPEQAEPALKDDVTMINIPAGPFEMGSNLAEAQEKPIHTVNLATFDIDQYEVTNGQYQACVAQGACTPPAKTNSETRDSYYGNVDYDDYPVIHVRWEDANTFCQWRGGRLPTEAEWEKAARGTKKRTYPWGDSFEPNYLNYCDKGCTLPWASQTHSDGYNDTSPVGAYEQGLSPYGVYDMAGNAWEWVADWYDPAYYETSPAENPTGPATGEQKITRGGGWVNDEFYLRTTVRRRFTPDVPSSSVGFRCARTP